MTPARNVWELERTKQYRDGRWMAKQRKRYYQSGNHNQMKKDEIRRSGGMGTDRDRQDVDEETVHGSVR